MCTDVDENQMFVYPQGSVCPQISTNVHYTVISQINSYRNQLSAIYGRCRKILVKFVLLLSHL